jgi:uncharacterized metal-binding protein YceD (DUF177 family)
MWILELYRLDAMTDHVPITRLFDLSDLSDAGYATKITASQAELARLAEWEGVSAVSLFEAIVMLKRLSQTRFLYEGKLTADLTQSCVVTLEPVQSCLSREFSRELHYSPLRYPEKGGALSLASAEDDAPEEIESLKFDLAGPLLEELSLAIDPYPRAAGVAFEPPEESSDAAESPFAVLKRLKRG